MSRLMPPIGARDHVRGNRSASIQLVEFGDFECPYCGEAYPIVSAIEEALGDRLLYAFRHFPLTTLHPHALLAAEAAEAAAAQSRFWEMCQMLFANQDALERDDLADYAQALGLDIARFTSDLASHRFVARVRADVRSGAFSGVNGTPTFFINGARHDGPFDYDSLMAALMAAESGASLGY